MASIGSSESTIACAAAQMASAACLGMALPAGSAPSQAARASMATTTRLMRRRVSDMGLQVPGCGIGGATAAMGSRRGMIARATREGVDRGPCDAAAAWQGASRRAADRAVTDGRSQQRGPGDPDVGMVLLDLVRVGREERQTSGSASRSALDAR